MNITLIGYMGSGKTTVGKALARQLKKGFVDLDAYIQEKEFDTVPQIIHQKGELYFRKVEKEALEEVLTMNNIVLAVGGGTPCFYTNMDKINQKSTSVYLRLPPNALAKRLENTQAQRPIIQHLKNEELTEFTAKHLFERASFYEEATLIINANNPVEEVVSTIENNIKQ